jgi:hypothetical protein
LIVQKQAQNVNGPMKILIFELDLRKRFYNLGAWSLINHSEKHFPPQAIFENGIPIIVKTQHFHLSNYF